MIFGLFPLRFCFLAREALYFPQGRAANWVRGGFGAAFRRVACVPECSDARRCERRPSCAYARLFDPCAADTGPSGLKDWPRPFVFRTRHLDGRRIEPGDSFHLDLHLFDLNSGATGWFVRAFEELAREGLGPQRRRIALSSVWQLDEQRRPATRVHADGLPMPQPGAPVEIELGAGCAGVSRVRVRFLTPTELKSGQEIAVRPEFPILAARIRDRLSALSTLYGPGPLAMDFRAFAERAGKVLLSRYEVQHIKVTRRSSRTGQTHPLGGFIGEAEYEGALAEFVPFLQAAEWTGVGRQTVWGKGEIAVDVL